MIVFALLTIILIVSLLHKSDSSPYNSLKSLNRKISKNLLSSTISNDNTKKIRSTNQSNLINSKVVQNIIGRRYKLLEVLDNERVESIIDINSCGNVLFKDPSSTNAIRGCWSWTDNRNILQIAVERVYKGKFSECRVKSHYIAEKAFGGFVSGRMFESSSNTEYENPIAIGNFVMIPLTNQINK